MNTDIDRLRSITFREFCDEWLDKLNPAYDAAAEYYVDVFRNEIFASLLNIYQKAEKALAYSKIYNTTEVFLKALADFVQANDESKKDIPSFERFVPILRKLGAKDGDSFLTVISILKHARSEANEAKAERPAGK
jgi:hypothetical protein